MLPTMPAAPTVTLLMVEPHADTSDMYAEFFRYHGLDVMTVSNAADALAAMPNADVVVTNMRLPGEIDGVELITRLRRDERTKHVPIVVVSAGVFPHDRECAQQAGCDVFLPKPCLPDTLLTEVRRLARSSRLRHVRRRAMKSEGRTSRNTAPLDTKRPA